jgi:protein SCO1/2
MMRVSRRLWLAVAATALVSGGASVAFALKGGGSSPPPTTDAFALNRRVPNIPLIDQDGRPTTLAAFRGKLIVLTPFLSLCAEVCPLTTGALLQMRHDVDAAGLANRVVFIEATVDPWRDSPRRLHAFARMTGAHFPLLTGTTQNVARLWRFFGVGYRKVPEGSPPSIDWWTHRPETFDVEHTDGLFYIDQHGHERLVMLGMPSLNGHLAPTLRGLLSTTGRQNLAHPSQAWTVAEALQNLSHLLGRPIPATGI